MGTLFARRFVRGAEVHVMELFIRPSGDPFHRLLKPDRLELGKSLAEGQKLGNRGLRVPLVVRLHHSSQAQSSRCLPHPLASGSTTMLSFGFETHN